MKNIPFHRMVLLGVAFAGTTHAAEFKLGRHTFTVPDGFVVERVADTNSVLRPVSASFDDQGRLYVTDSSGSNRPPAEQLKNPDHRLLRLEDSDGDGRFDESVVFADKVMFPQGCLWHMGSVYVAGPPSIWKFTDTDDDGVADQREEWFQGGTLTGCANDLHGPYLGPDGYLYWTKGAFAEQTHALGNGRVLNDRAAHIYRARPDGSDLDVIMSGGMDNPVEVAFTPEGEAIFTSTFIDFSQPGYRDGIAHAVYGGVFGKVNDVIEDGRVQRTGPYLLQPFYQGGPSAQCGLTRYESAVFGREYRDNFFATSFNLHKVTRHVLRPQGATFASTDSDFLVSDSVDFHPTDVLEDADGSLLVVDTGGWYKLCCPSSQLAKADVLGAIYRVRRAGAPRANVADVARQKAKWRTAADQSPYAAIKRTALTRDTNALVDLRKSLSIAIQSLNQPASSVADSPAHHGRAVAEALGRIGDRASVVPLLQFTEKAANDEVLLHSITYALIEIASSGSVREAMRQTTSPTPRRVALTALDQMDGSDLRPTEVVPFLSSTDDRLRETAHWILGRHPEWGGELAGWFREQLSGRSTVTAENTTESSTARSQSDSTSSGRVAIHRQLHILTRSEAGQRLLADAVTQSGFAGNTRLAALNAIADAGLREPPEIWRSAVLAALAERGPEDRSARDAERADDTKAPSESLATIRAAVRAARVLNSDAAIQAALLGVVRDDWRFVDAVSLTSLRLEAIAALPASLPMPTEAFLHACNVAAGESSPTARSTAADILSRAKLSIDQLATLAEEIPGASPYVLGPLLRAFDGGGNEALGQKFLAALTRSASAKTLPAGQLRPHFKKFPDSIRQAAEEFLATLDANSARQSERLSVLLAELQKLHGDVRRGQAVFNSQRTACATCHKIGYIGGELGPDLTRIGQARTERDLLEAIIFPSASFVRSYEPMLISTQSGDDYSGVLRRDSSREVILGVGPAAEVRIARSDIAEMSPGSVSVMPAGLDQQLSKQELADLIAFLRDTKWGAN